MTPPSVENSDQNDLDAARGMALKHSVRGGLIAVAVILSGVFALARWIDPYETDGTPKRMESHRQLGLPPCNFKTLTGYPCPSCGMTTSFSLFTHGDWANSVRANSVGFALALLCGLVIWPWAVISAVRGRYVGIRSVEKVLIVGLGMFLILMLARWGIVIGTGVPG